MSSVLALADGCMGCGCIRTARLTRLRITLPTTTAGPVVIVGLTLTARGSCGDRLRELLIARPAGAPE